VLSTIRAAVREPLVHFLLAGLGLFLLFSYAADSPDVADDEIVVSSGQIEHLTTIFVKTWQRAPTDQELRGLIDNFILEEVLYREATAFLDDDPERFRRDARISFEHVYVVDAESNAVETMLAALQNGEALDPDNSVSSGLLPRRFADASETTITSRFGESFGSTLFALDVGQWTGPVQSPFGTHLIRIEQIVEGRVPALDEIRGEVQREWLVDRREVAQQAVFDSLRDKYTITIEDYVVPGL
jgi:hypothetical protein